MNTAYKDVPGYQGVEILALRNGSIIVDHRIIIEASINSNVSIINATLENVTTSVKRVVVAISNETCADDTKLCFSPLAEYIIKTAYFSAEGICKSQVPPVYEKYYYPNMTTGVLLCMSDCTKGTSRTRNCNYGDCRISERGPECHCNDLAEFWYQGDSCKTRFRKRDVGFGLALAALAVIGTILAIFLFRAKRRKSGYSWSEEAEAWYGEDAEEEWTPTGALSIANAAAASVDGSQGRSKGFQPSLGMVDPSVQLQIQKPTVWSQC